MFWIGVILAIFGSLAAMHPPGAESAYFALTSIFVGAGLFTNNRKYKIAALIILVFCVVIMFGGYKRGIEYQEWLQNQPK